MTTPSQTALNAAVDSALTALKPWIEDQYGDLHSIGAERAVRIALESALPVLAKADTLGYYGISPERIDRLWTEIENDRLGRQLNSVIDLCAKARFGWVRVSAVHQLLITDPADERTER